LACDKKVLIVGATSAIAEATARLYATRHAGLYLLGRNEERLRTLAADLKVRGAKSVNYAKFDANAFAEHRAILEQSIQALGGLDVVLIAHGSLSDQKACERDFNLTLRELNVNAISVISLLTHLANRMESERHGTIAVISSVSGDRGRQSNYVYGTAKGALNVFLEGLRGRMHKSGVKVVTIKPGFVDTPMTAQFKKGPLWSTPQQVSRGIIRAIDRGQPVAYLPPFWSFIMFMIKAVPDRLFNMLRL
jgi:decaprenylphospho-beta-D-erythro-pentofuranosid-2-ulose 2-reductase